MYKKCCLLLLTTLFQSLLFAQTETSATQAETIKWLELQISMRSFSDSPGYSVEIWPFYVIDSALVIHIVKFHQVEGYDEIYESDFINVPLNLIDPNNIKFDENGITIYSTNNKNIIHCQYYSCHRNQPNILDYENYQNMYYFKINGLINSEPNGRFSTERLKNAFVNLVKLNNGKISSVKIQEDLDDNILKKF